MAMNLLSVPGFSVISRIGADPSQWIDSCCIDKSSSAELSEAINSMFQWYQASKACYAYLSDVKVLRNKKAFDAQFRASKWFTRGWTLQELLAPQSVVFYNHEWFRLGDKVSLEVLISSVTRIESLFQYQEACVAQKMSWASKRETLRIEDMAYCLLGLFGVNMPLLYGEGEKAFLRLQIEIMKISDDESLFAWAEPKWDPNERHGLLAQSPNAFENSGDIELLPTARQAPYTMTNKGLHIELELQDMVYPRNQFLDRKSHVVSYLKQKLGGDDFGKERHFVATLCCAKRHDVWPVFIALVRLSPHIHEYSRIICNQLSGDFTREARTQQPPRTIFIHQRKNSIIHRGLTTVSVHLLHDDYMEDSQWCSLKAVHFHPGLIDDDNVFAPFQHNKANIYNVENDPDDELGNAENRFIYRVGYGITILTFIRQNRPSFFVEVGIFPDQRSPAIKVLKPDSESAVSKLAKGFSSFHFHLDMDQNAATRTRLPLTSGLHATAHVFNGDRSGPPHHRLLVKICKNALSITDMDKFCEDYAANTTWQWTSEGENSRASKSTYHPRSTGTHAMFHSQNPTTGVDHKVSSG